MAWPAVAAGASAPARIRGDHVGGEVHLADPIVVAVRNEKIAGGCPRPRPRVLTSATVAGPMSPLKSPAPLPGESADHVRAMIDFADAIVLRIGDKQISAARIDRNPFGEIQLGGRCRKSVTAETGRKTGIACERRDVAADDFPHAAAAA